MKQQKTFFQKIFTLGWIAFFVLGIGVSAANCVTFDQFEAAIVSTDGLSLADCQTTTDQGEDSQECGPEGCSFCHISQGFALYVAPELTYKDSTAYRVVTIAVLPKQTVLVTQNSGRAPPLA
ncbi:MAG: hypothetical protein QNL04_15115 [SAR324 cluster bacterium]|nr:hypothetical protein [SAR324 cluster bacterium]